MDGVHVVSIAALCSFVFHRQVRRRMSEICDKTVIYHTVNIVAVVQDVLP